VPWALFEYAEQMKGGVTVLHDSLDKLSTAVTGSLQEYIVPLLDSVFKVTQKAATDGSSMASVSTAHD
jgi:hypothetical protein